MFNTDLIHPIVVHFPIALIITGFFIDFISLFFKREKCLSKAGFYLMVLGTLAAITAWSTGQLFTDHPSEGAILSTFEKHETGAFVTMVLMIIGTACRILIIVKKKEETGLKWIPFVFYLLGFLAVSFTGFMGGKMVYEFMMAL